MSKTTILSRNLKTLRATRASPKPNFGGLEKWPFWDRSRKAYAANATGRIRYSNTETRLQAAETGLAVACLPGLVAGEAIRSGPLIRLLQDFESEP